MGNCPKCKGHSLVSTRLGNGSTKHECAGSCGYLMVWKPATEPIPQEVVQ